MAKGKTLVRKAVPKAPRPPAQTISKQKTLRFKQPRG